MNKLLDDISASDLIGENLSPAKLLVMVQERYFEQHRDFLDDNVKKNFAQHIGQALQSRIHDDPAEIQTLINLAKDPDADPLIVNAAINAVSVKDLTEGQSEGNGVVRTLRRFLVLPGADSEASASLRNTDIGGAAVQKKVMQILNKQSAADVQAVLNKANQVSSAADLSKATATFPDTVDAIATSIGDISDATLAKLNNKLDFAGNNEQVIKELAASGQLKFLRQFIGETVQSVNRSMDFTERGQHIENLEKIYEHLQQSEAGQELIMLMKEDFDGRKMEF